MKLTYAESALPRIGISACLLGEHVRYDGGHKRNQWICTQLARQAELIEVCPEVGAGMGIPRPPIHLLMSGNCIQARGIADHTKNFTRAIKQFSRNTARELEHLSGFIFKARSPSCGLGSTPIQRDNGKLRKGNGLFAEIITKSMPLLPVAEETLLDNKTGRACFLEQVYTYHEWQQLTQNNPSTEQLLYFHHCHRLQLMAHGYEHLCKMERLLRQQLPRRTMIKQYGLTLMKTLRYRTTICRHMKVLSILCKQLQKEITSDQQDRLQEKASLYRDDIIPLTTVLKELKRLYLRKDIQNEPIQHYLSIFLHAMNI